MSQQSQQRSGDDSIGGLLRSNTSRCCVHSLQGGQAASQDTFSLLDALGCESVAVDSEALECGQAIRRELTDCLLRLERFEQLSRCPLVAVAGQLNAGKSSLVGTFLSPEARERIPRGLANNQGTHRFVLWMPRRWQSDAQLLDSLTTAIEELFAAPPTLLPEDIADSHASYVGAAETAAPLLAFDDALDQLGLGLIDCPDIQSGFTTPSAATKTDFPAGATRVPRSTNSPLHLPGLRQQQLHVMAKLCSAFVVVCGMRNLHDQSLVQILQSLRDSMPGVPRYLAVNRVKARYGPDAVLEQARLLSDRFGVTETYLAYDYRSAAAQSKIPPAPPELTAIPELNETPDQRQPIFFTPNAKQSSGIQYLVHLGSELDAGYLARESSRTLAMQLNAQTRKATDWIQENSVASKRRLKALYDEIAEACIAFMAERNTAGAITGLRMQTSPAIINQLTDSLATTAPAWMQMSMKVDRSARKLQNAIKSSASRLAVLGNVGEGVKKLVRRFKSGDGAAVVTPSKLAAAIRKQDRTGTTEFLQDEALARQCDVALKRFGNEDETVLDAEQLDQWSKQVWANMPMRQKLWKGAQPFAMLAAPFAAVILLPIDGGGSAVLVFASAKELLAAAGIATLLGPTQTGHLALEVAQGETAWRQLSNLFAICCDSLGIVRPETDLMPKVFDGKQLRQIAVSSIPAQTATLTGSPAVWNMTDELHLKLETHLSSGAFDPLQKPGMKETP